MSSSPFQATPDSFYHDLANALRKRLEVIGDRELRETDPEGHLEQLKGVSEQITALGKNLPNEASPQLVHFIERCSFDKALAFVEDLIRSDSK